MRPSRLIVTASSYSSRYMGDDVSVDSDDATSTLRLIVSEQPGLTTKEVFDSLLEDERHAFPVVTRLVRTLRSMVGEVHEDDGRWYPGLGPAGVQPQTQPEVPPGRLLPPATVASEPQPEPGYTHPTSAAAGNLNDELRRRLAGHRLIAEVGLDPQLMERVADEVKSVLQINTQEHLARRYPYLFMTYLVGHGVYGYEGGKYWDLIPLRGIDNGAGELFARRVREARLEDFDELVEVENALRWVAPILAHGGIPRYCVDDFARLIIGDLRRCGASAEELLAYWRTKKSAFVGVDKPVKRFLLYGGDIAVDFLDRCVAAVTDVAAGRSLPSAADAGLPDYVVEGFRARLDEISSSGRSIRRLTTLRPELILDPWSPFGPELLLPPTPADQQGDWNLWSGAGAQRVAGSTFETKRIAVSPAKAWHLEVGAGSPGAQEWTFEGLDPAPALFFDPSTGRAVPSTRAIRAESIWCLAPAGATITCIADGQSQSVPVRTEVPDLTGAWSGYTVRHLDLTGVTTFEVRYGTLSAHRRVQPESAKPQLIGEPIARLTTEDGLPVYAEPPILQLPVVEGLDPEDWRIRLTIAGTVHVLPAFDAQVNLAPVIGSALVRRATVTARGPLGADLTVSFAIARGLELTIPDRLLFPGERHVAIALAAPGIAVDGRPAGMAVFVGDESEAPSLHARLESADDAFNVNIEVPRLVWSAVDAATPAIEYTTQPIVVPNHAVLSGETAALVVRTGQHDVPLELNLMVGASVAQVSAKGRSGGPDGRWVFDLAPFRGTIELAAGDPAEFQLVAGVRPTTVMRLRPDVGVEQVRATGRQTDDVAVIDVEFSASRPTSHRVVRLWPIDRPWVTHVSQPVPKDESTVHIVIADDAVSTGSYIVEVDVDDGWITPVRPRLSQPNTTKLDLGSREERNERLRHGSALDVVERAFQTGHIAEHLTPDELDDVANPILEALHFWRVEENPGVSAPRGTDVVASLLCADVGVAVRAVNEFLLRRTIGATAVARLSLLLVDELQPLVAGAVADSDLALLWTTAPVLAARLDLVADTDGGRRNRLDEALGWSPADGPDQLFTCDPVSNHFIGKSADQLRTMRTMTDLMPKAVLDKDMLVAANFEWLIACAAGECSAEEFYATWHRRRLAPVQQSDAMTAHLSRREAERGTVPWVGFPALTLSAALAVTEPGHGSRPSHDLLWAAAEFAPQLVSRDLVLATALHAVVDQEEKQ